MKQLDVWVHGTPAPQGSKRHVGGGRMVESSKRVKPWRDSIVSAVTDKWENRKPLDGPLYLCVTFYLQRPKTGPKRRAKYHATRPDCDKLVRAVCDALQTAGVYTDDGQVAGLFGLKCYTTDETPSPRARIVVEDRLP